MALDHKASSDFKRAVRKALWRRVASWLRQETNELLPFYEVRRRIPIQGQHYLGIQTVPLDRIIGSTGRYRDFDRAFLPRQTRTRERWMRVDKAHLEEIPLPPVELFKMGEAYFVKDGNHRVSVAREQGQLEIEAEVIEIRVRVPITPDTSVDDLGLKEAYARFLELTGLFQSRPAANLEMTSPGEYVRLLEHINVHRWYIGEQREEYIELSEAAISWHDNVFMPLIQAIRDQSLTKDFPDRTEADLFLWINEYQWSRREAYKGHYSLEEAGEIFATTRSHWPVKKLVRVLRDAVWLDRMILYQELAAFQERTQLARVRPAAVIEPTLPGQVEKLLEHIEVHRWYLGEERQSPIPAEEAVASWYDQVYSPLMEIIRDQGVLEDFPGRSETDLYLWILENRFVLLEDEERTEKS